MDPIFVICTLHIAAKTSKSLVFFTFFVWTPPSFFRGNNHPPYHRAMGAAIGGCQEPVDPSYAAASYGSCVHPQLGFSVTERGEVKTMSSHAMEGLSSLWKSFFRFRRRWCSYIITGGLWRGNGEKPLPFRRLLRWVHHLRSTSFRTQRLKTLIGEGSEAGSCKGSAYGHHPISPTRWGKESVFHGIQLTSLGMSTYPLPKDFWRGFS